MRRQDKHGNMSEMLREALEAAPSLRAVERATGVKRQSLAKFMRQEQSLRLDMADRVAEYFGIVCMKKEK
ncbi:MAG TPA: helix-turn-helix transcriptional regulator [Candidatus Hydrogenedentes bacterium]|nr:helix-turn-helix transcriptional regulator [Candidatus Hydrogenedentota bacterium]HQE84589.1 helix-turn-helix transcriptional regulator [Candidatus Hydrogenedentota bacterium]